MLLQIELVLTLEEQLPECIHKCVITTKDITVHPNRVTKFLVYPKYVLCVGCGICSFICFNISHVRYWWNTYDPETKQGTKYTEVPGLIEKAQSDTFICEVSTEALVCSNASAHY